MSGFRGAGGCLCGGVRFEVEAPAAKVGLCHCKMCRRWGGGLPLTALHGAVRLHKEEGLTWWKSSAWGERGFCAACGSCLFWRLSGAAAGQWVVSAGALDDDSALRIVQHIFYDEKGCFYETSDDAERLGGAEFTAKALANLAKQHGAEAAEGALVQLREHSGEEFAEKVRGLM